MKRKHNLEWLTRAEHRRRHGITVKKDTRPWGFRKLNKITELCLEALGTDGDHHKQWYLEQILKESAGKLRYKDLSAGQWWDKGITP
jgi:hypothetical protein